MSFLCGDSHTSGECLFIPRMATFRAYTQEHCPIGCIMQTAKLIFFRFSGNHLYLLIKRSVLIDVYGN